MDRAFLERIFRKLLINFTWWVNRKDEEGNNLFEGGFLGLDNIGAFDRSAGLPAGGHLEQADGTSWMAMYCLNMLDIALALAREDPTYEDVATQVLRALRLHRRSGEPRRRRTEPACGTSEHGFYFDVLKLPDGRSFPVNAYTIAGLIPLFAIAVADRETLDSVHGLHRALPVVRRQPARAARQPGRHDALGVHERTRLALVDPAQARAHPRARARRDAHAAARTASARSRKRHARAPFVLDVDGQTLHRSTTSRPNRPAACSAATRTGAGRSGSRSTSCSSRRCRSTTTSSATTSRCEPARLGPHD